MLVQATCMPITYSAYLILSSEGSAQSEHVRSSAFYFFGQDSWKIRPNLTLNYGLRWELNTPMADVSEHVQTFRPDKLRRFIPVNSPPAIPWCRPSVQPTAVPAARVNRSTLWDWSFQAIRAFRNR